MSRFYNYLDAFYSLVKKGKNDYFKRIFLNYSNKYTIPQVCGNYILLFVLAYYFPIAVILIDLGNIYKI